MTLYTPYNDADLKCEFDGADPDGGEVVSFELVSMTREQFEDLGEFEGW